MGVKFYRKKHRRDTRQSEDPNETPTQSTKTEYNFFFVLHRQCTQTMCKVTTKAKKTELSTILSKAISHTFRILSLSRFSLSLFRHVSFSSLLAGPSSPARSIRLFLSRVVFDAAILD